MSEREKNTGILWSYLDDELNETQRSMLEAKLEVSESLRKELKEVKRLRSEMKELDQTPLGQTNFTDRVMEQVEQVKERPAWRKFAERYGKVAAVVFILVGVGLYLALQSQWPFMGQQPKMLSGFTPLFQQQPISKEEVFDFALHNRLPIDDHRQKFLEIGTKQGEGIVRIKRAQQLPPARSYVQFKRSLELGPRRQSDLDSILNRYARQLRANGLYQRNNALAVNAGLWKLNRAVLNDLAHFARQHGAAKAHLLPAQQTRHVQHKKVQTPVNDTFIIIRTDSVLSKPLHISMGKLRVQSGDDRFSIRLFAKGTKSEDGKQQSFQIDTTLNFPFRVDIDSHQMSMRMPNFNFSMRVDAQFDSMQKALSKMSKQFSFQFKMDSLDKKHSFRLNWGKNSQQQQFNFTMPNFDKLDSSIAAHFQRLDSMVHRQGKIVVVKDDSVVVNRKVHPANIHQRLRIQSNKHFSKTLEEIKKENEHLREEIEELRRTIEQLQQQQQQSH